VVFLSIIILVVSTLANCRNLSDKCKIFDLVKMFKNSDKNFKNKKNSRNLQTIILGITYGFLNIQMKSNLVKYKIIIKIHTLTQSKPEGKGIEIFQGFVSRPRKVSLAKQLQP
jgi:hypothetical protein